MKRTFYVPYAFSRQQRVGIVTPRTDSVSLLRNFARYIHTTERYFLFTNSLKHFAPFFFFFQV
jgi:hypothetical protein